MHREYISEIFIVVSFCSLIIGVLGCYFYQSYQTTLRTNEFLKTLSTEGFDIKIVQLHSPVYSVKVDTLDEFLSLVKQSSNPDTIFKTTNNYSSGVTLYTFDKDLKVGYFYDFK